MVHKDMMVADKRDAVEQTAVDNHMVAWDLQAAVDLERGLDLQPLWVFLR